MGELIMEHSEARLVRFGRTNIPYGIRRSRRRRTVSIAVDPEDGVLLTAPAGVPVERLDRVVKDRVRWILGKLHQTEASEPRPAPREFVSGESFLYLGRQYRLRIVPRKHPGPAKLSAGWLVVEVQKCLRGSRRASAVRDDLVDWYRARAQQRLPERVQAWACAAGGKPIGDIIIADQRRRWASCDAKGNLRFNWRVMQVPLRLVDYVVAHELVHLQHRDHTAMFWRELEQTQADFEPRRRALRELGPRTQW
ncbi:MAG: SprT family zinc-dependent metalloprotease [Myxococcota bacterium]